MRYNTNTLCSYSFLYLFFICTRMSTVGACREPWSKNPQERKSPDERPQITLLLITHMKMICIINIFYK